MSLTRPTDGIKMTVTADPSRNVGTQNCDLTVHAAFPEVPPLTPDGRSVADMPGVWHVAKLLPRLVKRYAFDLLKLSRISDGGVGFLLPMQTYTVKGANRAKRTHHIPMFPGMLFVCHIDPGLEIDPYRRTYGALRTVNANRELVAGTQNRLREDLLKIEAFALTDATKLNPFPFAKVGTRVKIASGEFAGFVGEVEYADGQRRRFIVRLDFMGTSCAYDLADDVNLEPID